MLILPVYQVIFCFAQKWQNLVPLNYQQNSSLSKNILNVGYILKLTVQFFDIYANSVSFSALSLFIFQLFLILSIALDHNNHFMNKMGPLLVNILFKISKDIF